MITQNVASTLVSLELRAVGGMNGIEREAGREEQKGGVFSCC